MLKNRIIPVLLMSGNSVVKSIRFSEHRMVGDIMSTVKIFNARNADELIILDVNPQARGQSFDQISRLAKHCHMPLTVGGGLNSFDVVRSAFLNGADKIALNSAFFSKLFLCNEIVSVYGSQALVISLDVKVYKEEYYCFSECGKKLECSLKQALQRFNEIGAGELLLTSILNDGALCGYELPLLSFARQYTDKPIIINGGLSRAEDISSAHGLGADAFSGGSIFYWVGETISTLKKQLSGTSVKLRN